MTAEYIEREYVLKCMGDSYKNAGISAEAKAKMTRWLNKAPAADVRPVVLCRDCKYNMANIPDIQDGMNINENWNACQLTELYDSVKPDDFCSRGVKRDTNDEKA